MVDAVLDKKGSDIVLLDLREQALFADYFLICTGENERQLQAMAESVAMQAKEEASVLPRGIEGEAGTGWVLLDYGDLVVHIFGPHQRDYYRLEELWTNAHTVLRMQ
ncbi:MAG: ribosome silencing factor [Ardenticatenaceae bacterium]|nr:ribosome silencing factor [Ardenticatenaceae bacterium]